jgi:hypothetical protein
LAGWEAEIGESQFKATPGQKKKKKLGTLYFNKQTRCDIHICIPATRESEIVDSGSKASLGKSVRPYLKNKLQQKGLRV